MDAEPCPQIQGNTDDAQTLANLTSLLPVAPHLAVHAELLLENTPLTRLLHTCDGHADLLLRLLVALSRLLTHDTERFSKALQPSQIYPFLSHPHLPIRFMGIRVLASFLSLSDAAVDTLHNRFLGTSSVIGLLDGRSLDYTLFDLWEIHRIKQLRKLGLDVEPHVESAYYATVGGVRIPIKTPAILSPSTLIKTESTWRNLASVARGINTGRPLLLIGPAGSGKSRLMHEIARIVCPQSPMISLHLNEQTDAKSLLGIHTSGTEPGTFVWKPGIITTAVRGGRWLLVENLDRAPLEVISLLLPLLESRQLRVPALGQTITAHPGFHLFATLQSSTPSLFGRRHWLSIEISPQIPLELAEIISSMCPRIHAQVPLMMEFFTDQNEQGIRALLRWAYRLQRLYEQHNVTDFVPAELADQMLLEGVDCFAGHLQGVNRDHVVQTMARILECPPNRAQHTVYSRRPTFQIASSKLTLGRVILTRATAQATQNAFATTDHVLRVMESIASAVAQREPCLLVGETGMGKTATIQQLAALLGKKLVVINMSQQSEASDLLGGLKPVHPRRTAIDLQIRFESLLLTTFPAQSNEKFRRAVAKAISRENWTRACLLWQEAIRTILPAAGVSPAAKRRKMEPQWSSFAVEVTQFAKTGFKGGLFAFHEGKAVHAVRSGDWLLLDEINLAPQDTLESLSDLLSDEPSIMLAESGNVDRIPAHPQFRIFGAMNPSTDVGKRNLPLSIRDRFTELFVQTPEDNLADLVAFVEAYLNPRHDTRICADAAGIYREIIARTAQNTLSDGSGHKPHFSLRNLSRSLLFALDQMPLFGLRRALYEGMLMAFVTALSSASTTSITQLISKSLLPSPAALKQRVRPPENQQAYVQYQDHFIFRGPNPVTTPSDYILTPFVQRNLVNLARAASARKYPVLIQGPTSSGKTSMVSYLAKLSGNTLIRINNHEHTELQEYLGVYVPQSDGSLVYKDGALVQAARNGHWLVLDELNLAPSDVLEALNRLLDDNRELFVPETQEVVRPHPNFVLFATQNPPGMYGGRKVLSRAFRNRFLELHFDDVPENELQTILEKRSQIAPSFCAKIVQVYRQLSVLRQTDRLFEQKNSFATLRDLFRWAFRPADTKQELAENGFHLLAERVRNEVERQAVKQVIEQVMKVHINDLYPMDQSAGDLVWTRSMRRVFVLVMQALQNHEPVLLVGETGCGKTAICQALAKLSEKRLRILNGHQNMETGDIIGTFRPTRSSLEHGSQMFEWADGSLVRAMQEGAWFLLDEICLVEDSVLERCNSVLEPERSIFLAEKGSDSGIVAHTDFRFLATMNPGGDFGKRELSPALRNRFTEIWVPPINDGEELIEIVAHRLDHPYRSWASQMVEFAAWFTATFLSCAQIASLRDLLCWATFVNVARLEDPRLRVWHGAQMVLDRFTHTERANNEFQRIFGFSFQPNLALANDQIGDFAIPVQKSTNELGFSLDAPTSRKNAMRVLRALQISRPILLEGEPGVGKTSLVAAIARMMGFPLTRINLSDETDLMDLFGSDVPVQDETPGKFAWQDAPFLRAMQRGEWVLLDEMNLASQSVLEGLNACLDHRGEVYIAELDQTFPRHPDFVLFAAQNPHAGGDGRKGLPASFLDRFTIVWAEPLTPHDLHAIFPHVQNLLHTAPDHNLRDIARWLQLIEGIAPNSRASSVAKNMVFEQRFRVPEDLKETIPITQTAQSLQVGETCLPLPPYQRSFYTDRVAPDQLEKVMKCIAKKWPVLLIGAPASGKSSLIRLLASQTGNAIEEVSMNPEMDTSDIIGSLEQVNSNKDVQMLYAKIQTFTKSYMAEKLVLGSDFRNAVLPVEPSIGALEELCVSNEIYSSFLGKVRAIAGQKQTFRWTDGPVIRAVQEGAWLVLDHANLCSPSVLDRLNSLMEPEGLLSVNEHRHADGRPFDFRPHPSFRIFLTMDPRYGELSRAMRNRCLEIFLPLRQNLVTFTALAMHRFAPFVGFNWDMDAALAQEILILCVQHLENPHDTNRILDVLPISLATIAQKVSRAVASGHVDLALLAQDAAEMSQTSILSRSCAHVQTEDQYHYLLFLRQLLKDDPTLLETYLALGRPYYYDLGWKGLRPEPSSEGAKFDEMWRAFDYPRCQSKDQLADRVALCEIHARFDRIKWAIRLDFNELLAFQTAVARLDESMNVGGAIREIAAALDRFEGTLGVESRPFFSQEFALLHSDHPMLRLLSDEPTIHSCNSQSLFNRIRRLTRRLCPTSSLSAQMTRRLAQLPQMSLASLARKDEELRILAQSYLHLEENPPDVVRELNEVLSLFSADTPSNNMVDVFRRLLSLFCPSELQDPALKTRLVRNRHLYVLNQLEQKVSALTLFEATVHGASDSARLQTARDKVQQYGPAPDEIVVFRGDDNLAGLQSDFQQIIACLLERSYSRITQIVQRLRTRPLSYADIVQPVILLLEGLSLSLTSSQARPQSTRYSTPFLGQPGLYTETASIEEKITETASIEERIHRLRAIAIDQHVLGRVLPVQLDTVRAIFHSFYQEWKLKLNQDQQRHQTASSFYRYRDQPELESIDQLDIQNDAFEAQVASLHRLLMTPQDNVKGLLMEQLEQTSLCLSQSTDLSRDDLLPSIVARLGQALEHGQEGTPSSFYNDANSQESLRACRLVYRVRDRFVTLQAAWPEHAVPTDVVNQCNGVLQLSQSEPMARLLTKLEQLHAAINEWQMVASRQYSASEEQENLTQLLISWRRLELTHWRSLLEREEVRCREAVDSWWFLAYEIIVLSPNSIVEVMATLIEYLSTTSAGQYASRLRMLRDFDLLLDPTSPMAQAMANLIHFYERFLPQVQQQIDEGRSKISKELQDICLLASWKDTNIEALRESAQRSHHQLLKVVRRYRAVLLAGIEFQSIPDSGTENCLDTRGDGSPHAGSSDPNAGRVEAPSIKIPDQDSNAVNHTTNKQLPVEWPRRFVHAESTVRHMRSLFSLSDLSHRLQAFRIDISAQSQNLQQRTPSKLTQENTIEVKRLQDGKRRLLLDTLKALRKAGFRWNLGADITSKQDSLAKVLATSAPLDRASEAFLHSMMQKPERKHEDLTAIEHRQCWGYLESIFELVLRQARVLFHFRPLVTSCQIHRLLPDMSNCSGAGPLDHRWTDHRKWTTAMLDTGIDLLKTHQSLSQQTYPEISALQRHVQACTSLSREEEYKAVLNDLENDIAEWQRRKPNLRPILQHLVPSPVPDPVPAVESRCEGFETFDESLRLVLDGTLATLQTPIPPAGDHWVTQGEDQARKQLESLRPETVLCRLNACEKVWQRLSSEDLDAAGAMLAATRPIIIEYRHCLEAALGQYEAIGTELSRLGKFLSESYRRISHDGFCSPSAGTEEGQNATIEEGTGLGEGEAGENISKDVGGDEDLSELAQEKSDQRPEEQQDAVNMDHDDLEGDGSEHDDDGSDESARREDAEDEVASVGDLDVDEKMWDGDEAETEKSAKGKNDAGQSEAAEEQNNAEEVEQNAGIDHEEVTQAEAEIMDTGDVLEDLDMPENLDMGSADGDDSDQSLSVDSREQDPLDTTEHNPLNTDSTCDSDDSPSEVDRDDGSREMDHDEKEAEGPDEEANAETDAMDKTSDDIANETDDTGKETDTTDKETDALDKKSDAIDGEMDVVDNDKAGGNGENANQALTTNESNAANGDNMPNGEKPLAKSDSGPHHQSQTVERDLDDATAEHDLETTNDKQEREMDPEHSKETADQETWRRLGDALEKWHNRRIEDAPEEPEQRENIEQGQDVRHLHDEEMEDDGQAVGAADQEPPMALQEHVEQNEAQSDFMPETVLPAGPNESFLHIGEKSGDMEEELEEEARIDDEEHRKDETEVKMEISWIEYENKTLAGSLALTEQLRLILTPTTASKMRGDFRSGKRLNIKRIIPFIASNYRKDKIWMRRSVPSKRTYQIMLAIDDSKSMGESGSHNLAFETLALVAKSLALLEVGQMCVVAFGERIGVAHPFDRPFSSEAGRHIMQRFSFEQQKTDVRLLLAESIRMFEEARTQATHTRTETWQLELIISDGVCEDHSTIRRLVQRAYEQRIMVIFIIVDTLHAGESILKMSEAVFAPDAHGQSQLTIRRYLDSFPFAYYLVVGEIEQLPGILAQALRQWFAEVAHI